MNKKWYRLGHFAPFIYYPWMFGLTLIFDIFLGEGQFLTSFTHEPKRTMANNIVEDYLSSLIPMLVVYIAFVVPLQLFSNRLSNKLAIVLQVLALLLAALLLIAPFGQLNSISLIYTALLISGLLMIPYCLTWVQFRLSKMVRNFAKPLSPEAVA